MNDLGDIRGVGARTDSIQGEAEVLVIGAGVGGYTAATLLQHAGVHTILLEAHDKPGGSAGYFDWDGVRFNAGATVVAGLWEGGIHRWVLDHIGASVDSSLVAGILAHLPDAQVEVAHDPARFRESVHHAFPQLGVRGDRFLQLQQSLADTIWHLTEGQPILPPLGLRDWLHDATLLGRRPWSALPWLHRTGHALLEAAGIGRVPEDQRFVALLNMLLQDTVQTTIDAAPALNCALGLDIYRRGVRHCRGGMAALHAAHLDRFVALGGDLRYRQRVTGIAKRGDRYLVTTRTGEVFAARQLVVNLTVWDLARLYPDAPASWRSRVARLAPGWGAFTLYLAVEESVVPPEAWEHQQVLLDYHAPMGDGNNMLCSLAPAGDPMGGSALRVMTVSTHTAVDQWLSLPKEAYRAAKAAQMDRMLEELEARVFPGLRQGLVVATAGTPKSFRTWTHRADGMVGGLKQTLGQTNFNALPSQLPGEPCYLVGDTVFPGQGTVACALSGITAWRRAMHRL